MNAVEFAFTYLCCKDSPPFQASWAAKHSGLVRKNIYDRTAQRIADYYNCIENRRMDLQ
jgi:hypothetical protein